MTFEKLRGDKTIQEIAAKRQLHPTQVGTWKRQRLEGRMEVFSEKIKKAANKKSQIKDLKAKIGQLAMESVFVSEGPKRLTRLNTAR